MDASTMRAAAPMATQNLHYGPTRAIILLFLDSGPTPNSDSGVTQAKFRVAFLLLLPDPGLLAQKAALGSSPRWFGELGAFGLRDLQRGRPWATFITAFPISRTSFGVKFGRCAKVWRMTCAIWISGFSAATCSVPA
jgi:hypothetical protein